MKTLLAALVAALAAALPSAPAALADGPPQVAQQYGAGVVHGGTRYVAVPVGTTRTMLVTYRRGWTGGGVVYRGSWGIPQITYGTSAGVSQHGDLLVLESTGLGSPTRFLVVDTKSLRPVQRVTLDGDFSFDALSPDASRLYLVQRVDEQDYSRYVVRAYDLSRRRLLPGRIADRTQRSWVMHGLPVTRVSSAGGRWVYTLYTNPGGYPFVHALDTVRGVAHCVGLPWQSPDQAALGNLVLAVRGRTLDLHWRTGRPQYRIDTATWRVSTPHGGGAAWWPALAAAGALLALIAVGERVRRRRRNTSVSVQGGSDGPTARPRARRHARPRAGGARRSPVLHRAAGR